jgi:hypothetical protein
MAGSAGETTSLLEDAIDGSLTPQACDLGYWFGRVGRRFADEPHGHCAAAAIPPWMLADSPIRKALLSEFAFRARTEESATRKLGRLVQLAPTLDTMDFYATQLIDEARHAYVFRNHLIDLGLSRANIEAEITSICGSYVEQVLVPLERFTDQLEAQADFIGGVVLLAIIAEGALAPAAELSALKWRSVDPRAAEIAAGANWDETRHLAVGSNIVRDHVRAHPPEKRRLEELIRAGMDLWQRLPLVPMMIERETLFQQGIERLKGELSGVELLPGRPLLETGVQDRLVIQFQWSQRMRAERLAWMGLEV